MIYYNLILFTQIMQVCFSFFTLHIILYFSVYFTSAMSSASNMSVNKCICLNFVFSKFQVTTVRAFHFVVNPPVPGDIYLGYLPLAHILELLSEFTMIVQGIPVGYSSPNTMIDKSTQVRTSVTRSGDFLDFGQFFKAFGNN